MFNRLVMIGVLAGIALISTACGDKPASTEIKAPEQPKQAAVAPVVEEKKVEIKQPEPTKKEAPNATSEQAKPAPTKQPAKLQDWKSDIDAIAKSQKTETEKFDEVSKLARVYQPSQEELKEFESFIVAEFKSGKYLKDVKNPVYMLSNIFRSTVVERQYDDKEKQPIDTFALDFLQNTKYTFRGEAVNSDSVKSNESQMKKALEKIK